MSIHFISQKILFSQSEGKTKMSLPCLQRTEAAQWMRKFVHSLTKRPVWRMSVWIKATPPQSFFIGLHVFSAVCVFTFCSRLEMIGSLAAGATPGGITNDQTRLLNGDLRPHQRPQSTLGSPSSWLFWQAIYQPERISRTGFRRRAVRANANEISTTMLCVRSAANSEILLNKYTRRKFLGTRRAEK
jgi:hypothetical protein